MGLGWVCFEILVSNEFDTLVHSL